MLTWEQQRNILRENLLLSKENECLKQENEKLRVEAATYLSKYIAAQDLAYNRMVTSCLAKR
jgi:hypothetical protein